MDTVKNFDNSEYYESRGYQFKHSDIKEFIKKTSNSDDWFLFLDIDEHYIKYFDEMVKVNNSGDYSEYEYRDLETHLPILLSAKYEAVYGDETNDGEVPIVAWSEIK